MSPRSEGGADADERKVVLDVEAAEELEALIADRPGTANEALLDDALDALDDAAPDVPPPAQERAAEGDVVVLGLAAESTSAVRTLIRRGDSRRRELLRRVRRRLQSKIDRARHKRASVH